MQLQAFAAPGGRHRVALRSVLPLIKEDSPRQWIQLAYEDAWDGHHSGPFEFDGDVFQTIIRNFNAQHNPVPLTYEHPQYDGGGMPVIAAGWLHELEAKRGKRGAELWGLVEFTDRAASFIRNGEYRYCSVVVDFASKDRKTGAEHGAELLEVGLTNVPFLDGMEPIRLSRRTSVRLSKEVGMSDVELIQAAIEALGKEASMAQVHEWVEAKRKLDAVESGESAEPVEAEGAEDLGEMSTQPQVEASRRDDAAMAEPPPAAQAPAEEPAAEIPAEETAAAADMAKLVDAIAAGAGVDVPTLISFMQEKAEAIGQAVGKMLAGEPSGTSAEAQAHGEAQAAMSRKLSVADGTIARLQAQVAELMAEKKARDDAAAAAILAAREVEAARVVDEAIAAGRALDAERSDLVWMQLNEPERCARMLSARGAIVPTGAPAKPKPPAAADRSAEEWRKHPEYRRFDEALKPNRKLSASRRHEIIVQRLIELDARGN